MTENDFHSPIMDNFTPIAGFSDYGIDRGGYVVNLVRGTQISPSVGSKNLKVSLVDTNGVRRTVSLRRLVAETYIPNYHPNFWTDVIHLDGNPMNVEYWNLAWRPRWFAMSHARQFSEKYPNYVYIAPVIAYPRDPDDDLDEIYFPSIDYAVKKEGLLYKDIINSMRGGPAVYPLGRIFCFAE